MSVAGARHLRMAKRSVRLTQCVNIGILAMVPFAPAQAVPVVRNRDAIDID